jgi:transposase
MKTKGISAEKLLGIIAEKDRQIAQLEQQVQWLMSQIRLAKHKQFGVSSERTDDSQLTIFNEAELNSDMTMPEPDFTEVKSHYRKRTRLTTDKLPKDLPVEVIEHKLPVEDCICPECGNEMHTMGKETREELKIIPARAVIVRHVQHVYACPQTGTFTDRYPIF